MIIGIEAERANNSVKTGVEHYAWQLIKHIASTDQKTNFLLYLRSQPSDELKSLPQNFKLKVIPFPKFWTQIRISWEVFRHAPDVLFIPASALPIFHPKGSVVTIHDTAWLHFPEAFTPFMKHYLHYSTKFACKRAAKIIAVSDATKTDLVKFYNIKESKIRVIPHGYEKLELPKISLSEKVKSVLPEKYIFFISTLQPRKNVERLIDAFRLFKKKHPQLPHKLVIAGKPGWKCESILQKIEDNKDIVVFLGHVSDDDRWPLYSGAEMFIHPSLYEGFGMWILEAFQCGTPVAVANNSSLPEVGGDAAVYFDPKNVEEIASVIEKIVLDSDLKKQLIVKGKSRLSEFGWEKCAKQTLQVFQEAYESSF